MGFTKRMYAFITVFCVTMLLSPSGYGETNKIYKWTDENGKVHFSDRPINQQAETLEIKADVSPEAKRQAQQQAQKLIQMQNRRVENQLGNAHEQEQKQREKEEQEKKLNQACLYAREQVKVLEYQAPIYTLNDKGEHVYIEDEQRKAELIKLKADIAEHCES